LSSVVDAKEKSGIEVLEDMAKLRKEEEEKVRKA
jgi:hypothetical protein